MSGSPQEIFENEVPSKVVVSSSHVSRTDATESCYVLSIPKKFTPTAPLNRGRSHRRQLGKAISFIDECPCCTWHLMDFLSIFRIRYMASGSTLSLMRKGCHYFSPHIPVHHSPGCPPAALPLQLSSSHGWSSHFSCLATMLVVLKAVGVDVCKSEEGTFSRAAVSVSTRELV